MPTTSGPTAQQQAEQEAQRAAELASARVQREMASTYFQDIAPAQATANRQLGDLTLQQQRNETDRGTQREQQYRQIASKYASRGMRTGAQLTDQNLFTAEQDKARGDEQRALSEAKNVYNEQYGLAGSADFNNLTPQEKAQITAGNFFDNPTMYGTVGTAARRAALARLQSQGVNYSNGIGA